MGKEFSLAVAAVAVSKAFDQSPRQGFLQIGREVNNLFTRTQEIVDPLGAYFVKPLEVKNSQIFWEGYDRSITASLRRNAALLRLNKAPKAEYEKAKAVIASAKVTEAAGYLHTDAQFFIGDYTIWTIVFPD